MIGLETDIAMCAFGAALLYATARADEHTTSITVMQLFGVYWAPLLFGA